MFYINMAFTYASLPASASGSMFLVLLVLAFGLFGIISLVYMIVEGHKSIESNYDKSLLCIKVINLEFAIWNSDLKGSIKNKMVDEAKRFHIYQNKHTFVERALS